MSEEYIQAILELWTKEEPEFEGKYVSFRDVAFEPKPVQKPHPPVWFGGDADAVLRRVARYASGWWPFLTPPEDIPAKLDFIRSQPDYNGELRDVVYGFDTSRVGEGHIVQDDPLARPGMSEQEIVDRLGWFGELGVTFSSVPIPMVEHIDQYYEYTQWLPRRSCRRSPSGRSLDLSEISDLVTGGECGTGLETQRFGEELNGGVEVRYGEPYVRQYH
jgi:hypothetical protein